MKKVIECDYEFHLVIDILVNSRIFKDWNVLLECVSLRGHLIIDCS